MANCKSEVVGKVGFLLSIAVFLFYPLQSLGQWVEPDSLTSISELRKDFIDVAEEDSSMESVMITGIANVPSGVLHESYFQVYLQNDFAGIPIFGYQIVEPVDAGDSVVVKGTKQFYFGQPELLVNEYKVYPDNQAKLEAVDLFEAFQTPRQYLGMLAEGTGIIREKGNRFNGKYLLIAPS